MKVNIEKCHLENCLNYLYSLREYEQKIYEAQREFCGKHGLDVSIDYIYSETAFKIVDLLDALIDCDDIVSYFVYELDFGKDKMAENCISIGDSDDEDAETFSLRNIDELWDCICEFKKREGNNDG